MVGRIRSPSEGRNSFHRLLEPLPHGRRAAGSVSPGRGRILHPQNSASLGFRGFVLPQATCKQRRCHRERCRRCQPWDGAQRRMLSLLGITKRLCQIDLWGLAKMPGNGLFLSTRFPRSYLPDRDVHRLPSWKKWSVFHWAEEFMFWSGGNEENFSTVSALEMSFLKLPKFSFAVP